MRHTSVIMFVLIISLGAFLLTGCGDRGSTLPGPGAGQLDIDPSATRTVGYGYLSTTFFVTITGGIPPYTVLWDFGDGTDPQVGQRVAHLFELPGTYNTSCLVIDSIDLDTGEGGTVVSGYVECRVFFSGV